MKAKEYEELYKQLRTYDDIKRLSDKYDEELLLVIFTERHVRKIKKEFYKVSGRAKHLLAKWKEGHSFIHLAHEAEFSPLMMAHILMKEMGISKKQVRSIVKGEATRADKRLLQEVAEAIEHDKVYSELGAKIQHDRGKLGEEKIRKWLEKRGATFREEKDLKAEGWKTVDFLLDQPLDVKFSTGAKPEKINWIESKASFGDMKKIKRDYDKQLGPYTERWGPGIVVYWFGFLEDMEMWLEARDVMAVRKDFFD